MDSKLTSRQQKALASLLEGSTLVKAADQASVSVRQLYRWMDKDVFRQALNDAQKVRLDTINARLLELSTKALDTLEDVLSDPGRQGQAVASITAERLLTLALKWRDQTDLEEQMAALEKKVGL